MERNEAGEIALEATGEVQVGECSELWHSGGGDWGYEKQMRVTIDLGDRTFGQGLK